MEEDPSSPSGERPSEATGRRNNVILLLLLFGPLVLIIGVELLRRAR